MSGIIIAIMGYSEARSDQPDYWTSRITNLGGLKHRGAKSLIERTLCSFDFDFKKIDNTNPVLNLWVPFVCFLSLDF